MAERGTESLDDDAEFCAMRQVHAALAPLSPDARERVLDYVSRRLNQHPREDSPERPGRADTTPSSITTERESSAQPARRAAADSIGDGISPVALKWMKRNGLTAEQLSEIYSLGIDDIDLVLKKVPGRGKGTRMQNVLRLKGIAEYLSSGVARVSHEAFNEACLHYDAHDIPHFSENMKRVAAEVTGSKETGYQLTAKGITAATELIKSIVSATD